MQEKKFNEDVERLCNPKADAKRRGAERKEHNRICRNIWLCVALAAAGLVCVVLGVIGVIPSKWASAAVVFVNWSVWLAGGLWEVLR